MLAKSYTKGIFLFLLFIGLFSSCTKKVEETFCNGFALENPTLKDSIDYSIINSIIEHYSHSEFIHIVQEIDLNHVTIGNDWIKEELANESIEYDSLILTNYLERNDSNYFLADSCMLSFVHPINHEEVNCLFSYENSGWEKYYQKYPNSTGILFFSRPGFNELKNHAIIEYCRVWDYLGAEWYIVLLDRINGKWIVTQHILTMVS